MELSFSTRAALGGLTALAVAGAVLADIRITEYMYSGQNGEFIEITNLGCRAVDLAGWSYDDSARVPGAFAIGSIGILGPGESAVITESGDAAFRTAWDLSTAVKLVPELGRPYGNNYGRNDTIVLYDASMTIVDRLDYGDQTFPGSIRTTSISGWAQAAGLGANDAYAWQLSVEGDEQGSYTSTVGTRGSPGAFILLGKPNGALGMVLTEYMYDGNPGEFIEFTNLSGEPIDMTGWMVDDSNLGTGPNGPFHVSAFGIVQSGESVIVTEANADAFRAAWGLPSTVKVIGDLGKGNGNGLGRNDEINIYDANGGLVDRLTYGDQDFPGSIRTQNQSGWVLESAIGANDAYGWVLSLVGDAQASWSSTGNDRGSPGAHVGGSVVVPADFNGDCIVDGNDLGTLLGLWGPCDGCAADFNGDGVVDGNDLGTLLGFWG